MALKSDIFTILLSKRPNPLNVARLFMAGRRKSKDDEKEKRHPRMVKIAHHNLQLIVIRQPSPRNIGYLKRAFKFHPLHLEDVQSPIQRPKIDLEDEYIFFVIHFPEFNPKTKKIETREIDFFLTQRDVIAIINDEFYLFNEVIKKFVKKTKAKEKYFTYGAGFLLYIILDQLVDSIFPLVSQIERGVEEMDQEIFSDQPKNVVEQISFLKRNIIFFQTMIKPDLNSFSRIETQEHFLLDEDAKDYFANITDHLKKIWDRLEDVRELTDNLSTTFEGYFSFKTSETIKVLTIFSVILLPLTLFSGIYGMNLSFLPLANHPFGLLIIGLFMIGMIVVMLSIFKVKRWV